MSVIVDDLVDLLSPSKIFYLNYSTSQQYVSIGLCLNYFGSQDLHFIFATPFESSSTLMTALEEIN